MTMEYSAGGKVGVDAKIDGEPLQILRVTCTAGKLSVRYSKQYVPLLVRHGDGPGILAMTAFALADGDRAVADKMLEEATKVPAETVV